MELLLPLIGAVAVVVWMDVGLPILLRQLRPGQYTRPFVLYKFRTMRSAHDDNGNYRGDGERTSAIGRLLRRTRLDEVPQFYNVLIGDMSLIGPRPLLPQDLPEQFTERITVRPGITGWAQVNGGRRLSISEKMALDTWYIRHGNFLIDVQIMLLTLRTISLGEQVNQKAIEVSRSVLDPQLLSPPAATLLPSNQPAAVRSHWPASDD